ncbi:MAG: hypothetical protein RSE07_06675, partial [Oscillospiraceae bacterium]
MTKSTRNLLIFLSVIMLSLVGCNKSNDSIDDISSINKSQTVSSNLTNNEIIWKDTTIENETRKALKKW